MSVKITQEFVPTEKRNRFFARSPRLGRFWCWRCDRAIVGIGGKCKLCKARHRPGVSKK